MNLKVNGKQVEIDENTTLKQLANVYKLDLSKTVVEINGEIINKNSAAYLILKENDSVEFIQFVGGG